MLASSRTKRLALPLVAGFGAAREGAPALCRAWAAPALGGCPCAALDPTRNVTAAKAFRDSFQLTDFFSPDLLCINHFILFSLPATRPPRVPWAAATDVASPCLWQASGGKRGGRAPPAKAAGCAAGPPCQGEKGKRLGHLYISPTWFLLVVACATAPTTQPSSTIR